MKLFRFNLEKLLDLRKYDEKKWEVTLGQIVSKCNTVEHTISNLKTDRMDAFFKYNLHGSGIELLQIAELYVNKINHEISQAQLKLKAFLMEKQEIQNKYVEAVNNRKVLDKLKDKEEKKYYKEQALEEMKEIDDISIGMALRKRIDSV